MLNHEHNHLMKRQTLLPVLNGVLPLEKKLEQLAKTANVHHLETRRGMHHALDHARQAGEALIAAKAALGVGLSRKAKKVFGETRGRFGRWLVANFRGSPELARVYMRVARNWENQTIRKARVSGLKPTTLNDFLSLVKKKQNPKTLTNRQMLIGEIIDKVKVELMDHKNSDLAIICTEFDTLIPTITTEVKKLAPAAVAQRKVLRKHKQSTRTFIKELNESNDDNHRQDRRQLPAKQTPDPYGRIPLLESLPPPKKHKGIPKTKSDI